MNRLRRWVFIKIDQVFIDIFRHEFICVLVHPRVHKGREIESGSTVELHLVVDELIGCCFWDSGLRNGEFWDVVLAVDGFVECGVVVPIEDGVMRMLLARLQEFIDID
jgi:hypothetical protein